MKEKVLIVDDQEINRDILAVILSSKYEVLQATNGKEALAILGEDGNGIALMLLDLLMPVMDGFEVLENMNNSGLIETVPVIVVSLKVENETERRCLDLQVVDFIRKPFDKWAVLRRAANVINLNNYRHNLEQQVQEKTKEIQAKNTQLAKQAERLEEMNDRIVELLGTVVEYRNMESGQHIKRVKGFTQLLAEMIEVYYPEYGLTPEKIKLIVTASALHDIGKIAISDSILLKPGRLTQEEFEIMKTHTIEGGEIIEHLKGVSSSEYEEVSYAIARYHHERFDGRGYPDGLVGDAIPIAAQIVSVADVYDALVSERCYKAAYSKEKAFNMIMGGECGTFSVKLLDCLTKAREDFEALADQYAG